jgi:hypothetical protein
MGLQMRRPGLFLQFIRNRNTSLKPLVLVAVEASQIVRVRYTDLGNLRS